ncbi:MarR family transcriptional regulator [Gammaproteobacteria bacterium]|nr:MarR family transcriptional regulator [Gammaproteobacteria bacterium]
MKLVLEMAEKMQEESISLNKSGKYHRATSAQIKIFDTLRGEKRSISSLSRKLGISRQATHKTVHQLVDLGLLKLEKLKNSRDKIVLYTNEGKKARLVGAKNLIKIEKNIIQYLGKEDYLNLKRILLKHYKLHETKDKMLSRPNI